VTASCPFRSVQFQAGFLEVPILASLPFRCVLAERVSLCLSPPTTQRTCFAPHDTPSHPGLFYRVLIGASIETFALGLRLAWLHEGKQAGACSSTDRSKMVSSTISSSLPTSSARNRPRWRGNGIAPTDVIRRDGLAAASSACLATRGPRRRPATAWRRDDGHPLGAGRVEQTLIERDEGDRLVELPLQV